jgi:hypothetical protein
MPKLEAVGAEGESLPYFSTNSHASTPFRVVKNIVFLERNYKTNLF